MSLNPDTVVRTLAIVAAAEEKLAAGWLSD